MIANLNATGAGGNELSSCKISGQYLEKQKCYQIFRNLVTFVFKKERKLELTVD